MKQKDWIDVKDRVPKTEDYVLACYKFKNKYFVILASYSHLTNLWYGDDGFDLDGVTHWMNIVLPND
jgi:hypothetical protein